MQKLKGEERNDMYISDMKESLESSETVLRYRLDRDEDDNAADDRRLLEEIKKERSVLDLLWLQGNVH